MKNNNKINIVESIQYSFSPNHRETMQALARAKLTSQESRVIIALLNQTDGYGGRLEDEIHTDFWQAITLMSAASINHTLSRLIERGVISKETRDGCTFFRLKSPNEWPRDLFSPQLLSKRALKKAHTLLSKERHPENFRWLKSLLATQPVVQPDKKSCPTRQDLTKKLVQSDNASCPNRQEMNLPKDSTKDSITKDSTKDSARNIKRISDLKSDTGFIEEMASKFPTLDIALELIKAQDYWGNRVKAPKRAFINWLEKACEFKGANDGRSQKNNKGRSSRSGDGDNVGQHTPWETITG